MIKWIIVGLLIIAAAIPAFAGEVESVGSTQYVTLPVVHDTGGRTIEDLTPYQRRFLDSVPKDVPGLWGEIEEMLLARPPVVDPPACAYHEKYLRKPDPSCSSCGLYKKGTSGHYFSCYQSWVGPHKVCVPIVAGPKGDQGLCGPQGPQGPQGPPGPAPVYNTYNFSFGGPSWTPSAQMMGTYAPFVVSTQLGGICWVKQAQINMKQINCQTQSQESNNYNYNQNLNGQTTVIAIDGKAAGNTQVSGTIKN